MGGSGGSAARGLPERATTSRHRILVASQSHTRVGGRETYVRSVLECLRGAGHEVAAWFEADGHGDDPVLDASSGVPAWTATSAADGGMSAARAWRPDLVFVNAVESPAWEDALLALAPAVRFLHAYDGACVSGTKTFTRPDVEPCHRVLGPACLAHYFPRGCGGRSPATMVRLYRAERGRQQLLRRYARLLVASHHMRGEYVAQGLAEKVRVVPLPVEMPPRTLAELPAADRTDRAGAWRVLFLGRFEPTKGPHLALEAAALVAGASAHVLHVQLSGEGALRPMLAQRAEALMAACPRLQVTMTPWLSRDETMAALDGTDLLVVPSVWPEPFGMVGVEAARRGVPAVAFDVGGVRDWLSDGRSGVLVGGARTAERLAAAIGAVLDHPAQWQRMREGCLADAGRFTPGAHLRALEAIFDEVLAAGQRRAPSLMPRPAEVDTRSGTRLT